MIKLQGIQYSSAPRQRLHAFCTHSRHIPHAFWSVPHLMKKGMAVTYVSLAAALSQGFALTWTHLVHIPDKSHARFLHMFQMRLGRIPDEKECYLGAELYRSVSIPTKM